MVVGQIQRNYIQQNSVGIGFFGYSGFSGYSGQAGVIGLPAGAFLWINDHLVFDSLNGFYRYGFNGPGGSTKPYWDIYDINDFATLVGPTAHWEDGIGVTGFTTKMRARALLSDQIPLGVGNEGSAFFAMRIRKVLALSEFNPYATDWNPNWSGGYADANVLVLKGGKLVFFGPLVGTAVSAVWMGQNVISGTTGQVIGWETSHLATPWVALAGDGNYMVEVMDFHYGAYYTRGWIPDKIFVEFAKVKN